MSARVETAAAPISRPGPVATGLGAGVWIYFATLTMTNALGDPSGLLSLPLQFTLKDRLGLSPHSLALFEVITFIPVYGGFAFGFLRDRWRPFGLGDRGYFLIGGPIAIGCYLWLASSELTYLPLLGAIFLAMAAYQLFDVASDALLTVVAQRHQMTGRLSAVVEGSEAVPGILAVMAGAAMVSQESLRLPLMIAALCSAVMLVHAVWYPRETIAEQRREPRESLRAAMVRLWNHRPLRVVVLIAAMWNLSLAWGTPYLFFLTDDLHLSSEVLGLARAAGLGCAVAVAPFYGVLCRRVSLRQMLRAAIVASLAPGFLYLFAADASDVLIVSVLVGLPTAFGHIALFDLLRRACPRDLEGTAITLSYSALALAAGAGDVVGAWMYSRGGFAVALVADVLANAAVLPMLTALPVDLIAGCDGEAEADAEMS
jgi:Na+/melibiose symporter-like transporter